MNYKISETYHGFKLENQYPVKEINASAYIFKHIQSGARLFYLNTEDDNKVFSVSFRTPPSDDTGVPHIIEHCVLSGSRKYTTKEPFMDMVKGSLKTFINAMTYPDKTIYPVASKNKKDFENLMDVYLDSVFNPKIYSVPDIFMQEGWHYDLHNVEDAIEYKGVVYNEMRGAYSSPDRILQDAIDKVTFPETCYGHSSGGNPDMIPDLTMDGFLDFHKTYYHPSNAYIYLYGDCNIDEYLKYIDQEYLSNYDMDDTDTSIQIQKPFVSEAFSEIQYPVSQDEVLENKSYLARSYVIGRGTDPLNLLTLEILSHILINASGAPLKKALIDAGIGEDILFLDNGGIQPQISFVAKHTESDKKEAFVKIIDQTFEKLVADGINKDLLLSAINKSEYNLREANQFPTKGLIYNIQALDSWLYDESPTLHLEYSQVIQTLKEGVETGYFQDFIKEHLLDNKHKALVIMTAKKGLSEEKAELLKEKLAAHKSSLNPSEINKLILDNQKLKEKQLSPDSVEDLATIPKLSVKDVNPKATDIPQEIIDLNGNKILFHEIFANNIAYVDYIFDTGSISKDELPYINLLSHLLGELDTKNYSYGDLSNQVYMYTGGIDIESSVYIKNNDDTDFTPKVFVSGKAIGHDMNKMFSLMNEIIAKTQFSDTSRIKILLKEIKSKTEMKIFRIGNTVASRRVASYFSPASNYIETMKGLNYYWFITDLLNNFDEKVDGLLEALNSVSTKVFNTNNMLVSFVGDKADFDLFKKDYNKAISGLPSTVLAYDDYVFNSQSYNEGIQSSSNVQYVAKGYNFKRLGYDYTGAMRVLETMLNSEFLHDRVRAKGGAYGCGLSFGKSGNLTVASYRDPNLEDTLDVYDSIAEFVDGLALSQQDIEKFIIGAMGRLDYATTPLMQGHIALRNYISNTSQEAIQKERDQILNTSLSDLKALAKLVDQVMKMDYICVLGNDNIVKQAEKQFNTLVSLNQ